MQTDKKKGFLHFLSTTTIQRTPKLNFWFLFCVVGPQSENKQNLRTLKTLYMLFGEGSQVRFIWNVES